MTTPDDIAERLEAALQAQAEADLALHTAIGTAIGSIDATLSTLSAAQDRWLSLGSASEAEFDAIKAEIAALPTPTPAKVQTMFGYTASGWTNTAGLAKPGVIRSFTPAGQAISAATMRRTLTQGIPTWYSWKPDLLSLTWFNPVESVIRTAMAGVTVPLLICLWHEPEGSTDAGGGTVAAKSKRWRDAHSRLHALALKLRAEGIPVYVAPIICDWTFWDTSKGTPADHWYPVTWLDYDMQGWDIYPRGAQANGSVDIARLAMDADYRPKLYADPARKDTYAALRLIAAHAAKCGKPWGSGETGIIRGKEKGGDTQFAYSTAQRAQRFLDIAGDLQTLQNPASVMCWYNDGGCNVTSEPDRETIFAWNTSIAANPAKLVLA